MASNNSTTYNYTYDDLLRLNEERAITLIPTMIILILCMIMGFTGNSLVCYIMGYRNRGQLGKDQNSLIVFLAIFDLLSCLLAIPADILRVRYSLIFPSEIACKVLRVIMALTVLGSIFILGIIAIDRYKKICKPLSDQMDRRQLMKALTFAVVLASSLSWPAAVVFGLRSFESPLPGQLAHDCSTADHLKKTIYPKLYTASLVMTFVVLSVCLITAYTLVINAVKRHARWTKQNPKVKYCPSGQENAAVDKEGSEMSAGISGQEADDYLDMNGGHGDLNFNGSVGDTNKQNICLHKIFITDESDCNKQKEVGGEEENGNGKCIKGNNHNTNQHLTIPVTKIKQDKNSEGLDSSSSTLSLRSTSDSFLDVPNYLNKSGSNTLQNDSSKAGKESALGASMSNIMSEESDSNDPSSRKQTGQHTKSHAKKTKQKRKKSHAHKKETKATQIAFLITIVFILSFLPYLSLRISEDAFDGFDYNLRGAPLVFHSICLRSYYINSISNPIIYGVLNIRFRNEVKRLIRMYLCKA